MSGICTEEHNSTRNVRAVAAAHDHCIQSFGYGKPCSARSLQTATDLVQIGPAAYGSMTLEFVPCRIRSTASSLQPHTLTEEMSADLKLIRHLFLQPWSCACIFLCAGQVLGHHALLMSPTQATLRQLVATEGPLPELLARRVLAQVITGAVDVSRG